MSMARWVIGITRSARRLFGRRAPLADPARFVVMKARALAMLMVTLGAASMVARDAPGKEPKPDEVVAAIAKYDEAWDRRDASALGRLLAADYVYFTSKGALWPRQRFLDLVLSPKYLLEASERSEIEVHRTGNTAVASSRWKGHGTYDGKVFRDDQRCSLVLLQERGKWTVLSEHCTQIVGS
jgi:ketosteroid isomerase-like protein